MLIWLQATMAIRYGRITSMYTDAAAKSTSRSILPLPPLHAGINLSHQPRFHARRQKRHRETRSLGTEDSRKAQETRYDYSYSCWNALKLTR